MIPKPYVLAGEAWMIPVYFGSYGVEMVSLFERALDLIRERTPIMVERLAVLSRSEAGEGMRGYLLSLGAPLAARRAGVVVLDPKALAELDGFTSPLPVETRLLGGRSGILEPEVGLAKLRDLASRPLAEAANPGSDLAHFLRRFSCGVYSTFRQTLDVVSTQPRRPAWRTHNPNCPVVVENPGAGLPAAMRNALVRLGGLPALLDPSEEVIVKPNLQYREVYPSVTRPEALEALLGLLLGAGYRVRVVESSDSDTLKCARDSGLLEVCERLEVPFVPAEFEDCVTLTTGIEKMPYVDVFKVFYEAKNLVCLSLVKIHQVAGLTAACTHLLGTVSHPARSRAHEAASTGDGGPVHALIAFLNRVIAPRLTIVDAEKIVLGRGPGCRAGQARVETANLLLAGRDTLALDRWVVDYLNRGDPHWNPTGKTAVEYLDRLLEAVPEEDG